MNIVKEYKQYFTPLDLADFMVSLIPDDNINTVVDLSMGECGLLEAAKKRWNTATYLGADIDRTLLKKIHANNPYIRTFAGDSLGETIDSWREYQIVLKTFGFDLAIANPPFNYYDQASVCVGNGEKILAPIEIRFLLKYIDIVRDGGYICIILPYGFLSLDLYSELRQKIIEQVTIHKIIKIFDKCFDRIDADTCLLLLQKKSATNIHIQNNITTGYLDSDYKLGKCVNIEFSSVTTRLDMEYHQLINAFSNLQHNSNFPVNILRQYVTSCKRGKTLANKKEFIAEKGIRFLHTTDVKYLYISKQKAQYVLKNTRYFKDSIVKPENILIGRVGKACIGKVAIMSKRATKSVISDCIFCLEVDNIDPYYLTLYLASRYGQMQLKGLSKGSCSKYITKEDLLSLKIIVPTQDIQELFREKYLQILSKRGRTKKDLHLKILISEVETILGKE